MSIVTKLLDRKVDNMKGYEIHRLTMKETIMFVPTDKDLPDIINSITFFENLKKKCPKSPIEKDLNKEIQFKIDLLLDMLGKTPEMKKFKKYLNVN